MGKKTKKKSNSKPSAPKREFAHRPFTGLPKTIDSFASPDGHESESTGEPLETGDPPGTDEEWSLEREWADVEPLKNDQPRVNKPAEAKPMLAEADEDVLVMRHLDDLVHGYTPFDFADTDEYIEAAVADLDRRIVRKLRRGEYALQGHLDLHGQTKEEARLSVIDFIRAADADNKRCVLIVHGRGTRSKDNIPVLKNKLRSWLTRGAIGKRVLAFTSARPYDGGTGAVYVLLRS